MGRIFYLMGKSASGKDTLYKRLRELRPELRPVVLYTTRPVRSGEVEGKEYHFVSADRMEELEKEGRLIEKRVYETKMGPWVYATADDGQMDLEHGFYLMIGTLESFCRKREYFGKEKLVPLYIETEDRERLLRAIERERAQARPEYAEVCRRFLADEEDFKEENLRAAGIERRFVNREIEACAGELAAEIGRLEEEIH